MTTQITLQELAEKLNGKFWSKNGIERVYLEEGHNTKKMSTKTYVFKRDDGSFGVSCYIDCPSQPYQWIESQKQSIIESVEKKITEILNPANEQVFTDIINGERYEHPKWGIGVVVKENEKQVIIAFGDEGNKTFAKKHLTTIHKLTLVQND